MDRLISRYTVVARTMAWIGIFAIIVLSVVPANDRPVSGVGQGFEHFTAFALVGGAFAIGYRFSLIRLLVLGFPRRYGWSLFCDCLCLCRHRNLASLRPKMECLIRAEASCKRCVLGLFNLEIIF
jgi:hypothetical protein